MAMMFFVYFLNMKQTEKEVHQWNWYQLLKTGNDIYYFSVAAANRQPSTGQGDLIHMATVNPVSLYTMNPRSQNLTCIDLYDIFPTHRSSYSKQRVHLAPLGFPLDANVVLHEEVVSVSDWYILLWADG